MRCNNYYDTIIITFTTFYILFFNDICSTMHLLIVDDSKLLIDRLIPFLSEIKGIDSIDTAADVASALEIIKSKIHDITILDIQLPDGSGIDILKEMKKINHPAKIIMLTNYAIPIYKRICLEQGADFFLDKTMEFEKVYDICSDFIENTK